MTQLFDPASHTFWRNVKERAVAPVTAFGRNPARWDVWEPAAVPSVPTWCAAALINLLTVYWCTCFTAFCLVTCHCFVPCDLVHMLHCVVHQKPRTVLHDKLRCVVYAVLHGMLHYRMLFSVSIKIYLLRVILTIRHS